MKNQKGVTLMLLVATVAIMSIILGTISYSSISALRMKLYYDMCADIELLDEKIALYYLKKKELPIQEEEIEIKSLIPSYDENNENFNPNNSGVLSKINFGELDNLSLNNSQDYYIDKKSHTIYFSRGIEMDGYTYYTIPLEYQEVDLQKYR